MYVYDITFSDWQNWFDPDLFVLFPACADHDALQTHRAGGSLPGDPHPGGGERGAQGHKHHKISPEI